MRMDNIAQIYFFFRLPERKSIKKKGHGLRLRCYSDTAIRRRGSNSLRSNNRPLPAPDSAYAHAPTPMPESCAVQALRCYAAIQKMIRTTAL